MKKRIMYVSMILIVILVSILIYGYIRSNKNVEPLKGTFVIGKIYKGYL